MPPPTRSPRSGRSWPPDGTCLIVTVADRHQVRLGAVQETLFIPLAARARETRRKRPAGLSGWPFSGPAHDGVQARLALRGRPRGRLSAMTAPFSSNSPPQTPHGSPRCSAPARQAARIGQPRHSALACRRSCGSSAKNSSGSRRQGSSGAALTHRSLRVPVGLAAITGLRAVNGCSPRARAPAARTSGTEIPGRSLGPGLDRAGTCPGWPAARRPGAGRTGSQPARRQSGLPAAG